MRIITNIPQMRDVSVDLRNELRKIALVPTMGYLHAGHLSLIRKGREARDVLVVSIFVNPAQFGRGEDLEKYPRDMERDAMMCKDAGVDIIFAPGADDMYPDGYQTYIDVADVSNNLCGLSRQGHFRGVATVVTKLFNIVRPDKAIFGNKDFQQLVVIRRLVRDLHMDVEVIGMPTIREPDGLALSSRNRYLTEDQRKDAAGIYKSLKAAEELLLNGVTSVDRLVDIVSLRLSKIPAVEIEYVKIVDPDTMTDLKELGERNLLAVAAKIGKTRLIDNILLYPAMRMH